MSKMKLGELSELAGFRGQEVVVSNWLQVTQRMIDEFAEATGDHQWIHIDTQRAARESPFGATIAHGFLTLSLLSHFLNVSVDFGPSKMGVNYGLNRVRFTAPVRSGSRLRTRFVIDDVQQIEGGVQIVWGVTMECEGADKPVLVAEWLTRRYD